MRDDRRYNFRWLSGILMLLLLLTGCSKSSENDENDEPQPGKPVLKIYVFSPDRPIVTRGDNGEVDASEAENKIHNIHVWVYETGTDNLIGHISLNNVDITEAGKEVTMELDDTYANLESKPNVDVYVAANVTNTNCGLSFDATTTNTQLNGALIKEGYFGVTNLISTVPGDGLPMSGVLKNKPVMGNNKVYQVQDSETSGKLANVRLVRAVSKIRFVASKSSTNPDVVTVNSIVLNGDVLPKEEYLFLANAYDLPSTPKWSVGTSYVAQTTLVSNVTEVATNNSPASYSWDGSMSGQQYETKIQNGIDAGELSDLGTFYLRESDRALKGTINYTIEHTEKNNDVTTIQNNPEIPNYAMVADGDFSRNHTWIVYAYFVSSGDLIIGMVEVKDLTNSENATQIVYNW
ncbi:MAG: hypothetical protein IKD75_12035 [Prevotella sp.]|nr:hypothetical protein [Prevotella sp.]